ncbi:hypothetical protein ADIAL_2101 [Alkalibacterium sp. AK22]|uniref:nucleotide pyrophosphohydrolase n=1 Tax=Alkalibacterium sp. AK22 TaxID=1229520 RepID=UPI000452E658|nr:nucleotide pyrophosphohydrolase [Alkalibacterium sp. AK22]EXJ22515.1 hypothetical protein ADIAL_2101 [Alkalibacterium sp. AK22]
MDRLEEIEKQIEQFRNDRDWAQYHNPKDLAISLSIEVAELLENFQWKISEDAVQKNKEDIKRELADVLIYSIMLSNEMDLDLETIIKEKLKENEEKYPIDKSKGSNSKYTEFTN